MIKISVGFIGLLVTTSLWAESTKSQLQNLQGTYRSPNVEPWYGGYGTREFVFNDGHWQLIFIHALDPEMKMRTFQFRTGGSFDVKNKKEEGGYYTVFGEDWKKVTLFLREKQLINKFGFANCDLQFNQEVDISAKGCAKWKPVSECSEDHDLLKLDGNDLYFGERPHDNDMCSRAKRTKKLLEHAVRKFFKQE